MSDDTKDPNDNTWPDLTGVEIPDPEIPPDNEPVNFKDKTKWSNSRSNDSMWPDLSDVDIPDIDPENPPKYVGIPEEMKVKRRFVMTEKAYQQRVDAAKRPRPGAKGNRNSWKHGKYSKNMLTRIKPCLKSCSRYPCSLVSEGATKFGGDCLDAAELLHIVRSIHRVLVNPEENEDLKEIAAVNIGSSVRILEMLQEDILRDGTLIRSRKYDKNGECIQEEYKVHPSLHVLPKLIADLGMTPDQFMITPKAQARNTNEEDAVRSIADLMKTAGQQMAIAQQKRLDNGKEDDESNS